MSKAVLILDKIPERCGDCRLHRIDFPDVLCSGRKGKPIEDVMKPDWCPLQPLPEKRKGEVYCLDEDGAPTVIIDALAAGWNACLDAITGGENE